MQSASPLSDALMFVALCGLVVFLPGGALLRLLRVEASGGIERLFLSGVLGFAALCSTLVALGPLSPALAFVLPAGAAAVFVVEHRRGRPLGRPTLSRDDLVLAASCALVLVALIDRLTWWREVDGGFAVTTYYDHFLHTAVVGQLSRELPLTTTPYVAGELFWPYHPNTNLFAFFFVRFGGVQPLDAHLVHLPAFAWLLVAAGLASVARRLTGSALAGVVVNAAYFLPRGALPLMGQADALGAQDNSPSLLALPLVLGAAWAVVVERRRPSRGAFLLASICVGALFSTKANIFLAVGPAFAVYAAVELARGRRADVGLGAIAGLVVVAVPVALHLAHPMARGMGADYGAFATWLAGRELGPFAPGALSPLLEGWPVIGPVLVVLAWLLGLGGGWWAPALLGLAVALRRRALGRAGVAVGALLVCVLGVCLVPTEEGARQYEAWNVALFLEYVVTLLVVLAGASAAVMGALRLLGEARLSPAVLVVVALGLQGASTSVVLARGNPHAPLFFPSSWVNGMEAIRRDAPPGAVVASEINPYGGTYVSGFALRPGLVERVVLMGVYYPSVPARLADLDLAFGTRDPAVFLAALRRWGVSHVVEEAGRPLSPDVTRSGQLRLFFAEGDLRVWALPEVDAPMNALSPRLVAQRSEAGRRYRAALDVLEGQGAAAVAEREAVTVAEVEAWIDRATHRRSILDEAWGDEAHLAPGSQP